eukprot:COSAG02_NODE_38383_length_429_cov_1.530303_1_plen_48_part_10
MLAVWNLALLDFQVQPAVSLHSWCQDGSNEGMLRIYIRRARLECVKTH